MLKRFISEKDSAWIDVISEWDEDYKMGGWDWLNKGTEFFGQVKRMDGVIYTGSAGMGKTKFWLHREIMM